MKVGITGGTGFVGSHFANVLLDGGHEVVLLSRGVDQRKGARRILSRPGATHAAVSIADRQGLARALEGCDAVAHCAGINREIGAQTYARVHVEGTANVIAAAEEAGVRRIAMLSFLRARPDCGLAYHESKWEAEELVRASGLEWTVIKAGMIYGLGYHFLDHLSHALHTFPIYVGIGARRVRPLCIDDLVRVLHGALVEGSLVRKTVPVLGPTEIGFDDAVAEIAAVVGRRPLRFRMPMAFHYMLAVVTEALMTVPLLSRAQVRMLAEEIVEPANAPDALPAELVPRTLFDASAIRRRLPAPGRFGLADLRCCRR